MAAIGDLIANYRITGVIGRGMMSTVYRAHDERLDRDVALKLLDPGLSLDFIFRARFERESRVTAQIRNDHIVPVYDAGTWDDGLFIAMALVDGPNAAEVMKAEGPLELARVVSIVTQVADALDDAHAHRIVHRDVKPANILLVRHGSSGFDHAYLADFGLTLGMEGTHLTRTGGFMGTLAFSAPEQLSSGSIDGRADQYALAATTFQMLTGQMPFRRDNEMALINAQMFDPPPRVTDVRPTLPRALNAVIARGMAKKPEDRYATAGEFARALTRASGVGTAALMRAMPSGSNRLAAAVGVGILAAAAIGAVALLAVVLGLNRASPTASPLLPPTTPFVAVTSPTPIPTAELSPALSFDASMLPTPGSSMPTTRTPRPSHAPPTPTPRITLTPPPPTPTPTPTPTPAPNLPLVADGTWSVDNSPSGVSGDPYVVVGEHHRRYEITSHCASEADCRLSVDTFDADGHRLGSITFKWNGNAYVYRGGANWYSRAGGDKCETSTGEVIDNAYATHEEVHVAPPGSGSDPATHMSGTKSISGTPTAAGTAAGCQPFEMRYDVVMNAV